MFKLAKILSKLGLNPQSQGTSDKDIVMSLVTELINNLDKAEEETLNFIAKIYNEKPEIIDEIGFTAEIALWWNVYFEEKNFFMKLLQSNELVVKKEQ
jgi:hypothetical protein